MFPLATTPHSDFSLSLNFQSTFTLEITLFVIPVLGINGAPLPPCVGGGVSAQGA